MTIPQAVLDSWPLVLPDSGDDRSALRDCLLYWNLLKRERSPTLHLGPPYTGNEDTDLMKAFLNESARPRRLEDPVAHSPQLLPLQPTRKPPPAFSRGYSTIHNLTAIPGCTGKDRNSQVFRGVLGPDTDAASDAVSAQVAVKIFETSLLPPSNYYFLSRNYPHRHSPPLYHGLQTFEFEIWAYKQLKSLQGSLVPHIYGFFRVVLPHGEPCIALVLEYIEPISHEDFIAGCKNQADAVATMGEYLSHAMQMIHACEVYHSDLAGRNVLLPVGSPLSPVLIDFADARPLRTGDLSAVITAIINSLEDIGFDKTAAQRWAREKLHTDRAWAAAFDVDLGDAVHVDQVLACT